MTAVGYVFYLGVGLSAMGVVPAIWLIERHLGRLADQGDRPPPGPSRAARLVAEVAAQEPAAAEPAAERSATLIDGVRFRPDPPTGGLQVGDPYRTPILDIDDDPCIAIRHGQLCVRQDEHEGPHVAVADDYITALWSGPGAELDTAPRTEALSLVKAPRQRDQDTGEHDTAGFRAALDSAGRTS